MRQTEDESRINTLGRTPQLPSRVAAAITSEILEGRLKHGDRLPAELTLAAKFGVSRSVIREAIARLRSDGVIQSRQGIGAFVANSGEGGTLRIDADLMSDRLVFGDVFEMRAILEIRAAGLAARRRDDQQLSAIEEAFERMRSSVNWADDGVTADLEFHRAVAAASGNAYILMVVGFFLGQMRQSIMFMRHNQNDTGGRMFATNVAEHAAILESIRDRDAEAATAAMRSHITRASERLGYALTESAFL